MRRVLAAILAIAGLAGCGDPLPPEQPRAAAKAATAAKGRTGSESTREAPDPDSVPRAGKAWGGWRYAGSRDDCFFLVGRRCFATEAAACKAAKCGRKQCVGAGGGPTTMRCR